MLGWFKKKFAKKEETSLPVQETEPLDNAAIADQPLAAESDPAVPAPEKPSSSGPTQTVSEVKAEKAKPAAESVSMFKRLSERLSKTRDSLIYRMDTLFLGKKVIDAKLLDDLEELLVTADLGITTTTELLDHARQRVKRDELSDPAMLKEVLKEKIRSFITESTRPAELVMPETGPFVIMVIGVNGVGKTTTIGKIAHKFLATGQSVMLVAADTFRAAAVSQLQIWGERNKVKVVAHKDGADPSSVVFDALATARAENYDVVLVDTAGRLHTQTNLMEELKKIKRVMDKQIPGAPHEVMLVIDATTGQNGISQAKLFNNAVEITGITLTKLDGTAKGGIVANICRDLKIPIRFIGIGEQLEDLRDFDPDEFIDALFQKKSDDATELTA
ncbi:MAG: signal recognition particle-docking protein FtsY [Desulfocapsaceae bacterium]|nr:signal recognition particle-docking protein FtsY [Desulfocapsaceae bacterium]